MTLKLKTVTDHILEAQALLDRDVISGPELTAARECLDAALTALDLARVEGVSAWDKL